MTYENPPALKLVSVEKGFERAIEVRYQGKRVSNLVSAVVTIENTGTEPITKADYEEPITVYFGRWARILQGVASLDTGTEERDLPATVNGQSVEIEPILLNPGDRLRVGAFLTRSKGEAMVTGRIAGVKEITRRNAENEDSARRRLAFVRRLFLISSIPFIMLLIFLPEEGIDAWWFYAVFTVLYVVVFGSMLVVTRTEKIPALREWLRIRRS